MTDAQLSEINALLQQLENQLQQEILAAKLNSQPVALDQQAVGRVSRIDSIQQQQMHLSAFKRLEQRLALVRLALKRLSSDEFGYCANCEEPISIERLRARPESPVCISCAKKMN